VNQAAVVIFVGLRADFTAWAWL